MVFLKTQCFRCFLIIQKKHGFKLLLVMDGDRNETIAAIDNNRSIDTSSLVINGIVREEAYKRNIQFLDLQPVIEEDYRNNRTPFHFRNDNHWNQYMHKLVAREIFGVLPSDWL